MAFSGAAWESVKVAGWVASEKHRAGVGSREVDGGSDDGDGGEVRGVTSKDRSGGGSGSGTSGGSGGRVGVDGSGDDEDDEDEKKKEVGGHELDEAGSGLESVEGEEELEEEEVDGGEASGGVSESESSSGGPPAELARHNIELGETSSDSSEEVNGVGSGVEISLRWTAHGYFVRPSENVGRIGVVHLDGREEVAEASVGESDSESSSSEGPPPLASHNIVMGETSSDSEGEDEVLVGRLRRLRVSGRRDVKAVAPAWRRRSM